MKKHFFNVVAFASIFSMSSIIAADVSIVGHEGVVAPLVDNSGQDRIVNIMSQIKHDVVPGCAESIAYVQVSNIDQDLNIKAIAEFFDCKTVMGDAFLRETLQRPVSPIDESGIVDLRISAITQLVENSDFKKQVEALLEIAANEEKVAMELMSNTFKASTCPELEGLRMLKEQNHPLYSYINFMHTNPTGKTILTSLNLVGLACDPYLAYTNNSNLGVLWGFCGVLNAYQMYDDLTKAGQKRVKMHALNQLIHVAESIEDLFCKHYISRQFKMSLIVDREGVELVDALKASRYENKTNYCFYTAAVHTFLYKIYQNDTQLAQIFASIAEMDAYNAIATKILEGQNSNRQFCFADKLGAAKPMLISKGFWNLLVPGAVINSMNINQHVILTGPNAGGKTTSIRANLQNIILAQTYGIAAAEQFEYTQFDVILSYLNISDDLINGLSLFASEIKRAKDVIYLRNAL
jgi:hypothetical protein